LPLKKPQHFEKTNDNLVEAESNMEGMKKKSGTRETEREHLELGRSL
jgi:hypothetical protein